MKTEINELYKDELNGFYKDLVSPILDEPKKLKIYNRESPGGVIIVVESESGEHGRLIGAQARTFLSCETLLTLYANRLGTNVHLVIETSRFQTQSRRVFVPNNAWNEKTNEWVKSYITDTLLRATGTRPEVDSMEITETGTIFYIRCRLNQIEREAMSVLLRAVGKKHGRYLYLEFSK